MTARYGIKEVAARTGFPAATLRFYDEIGLAPAPERTAAGYRRYDDASLQRLAFIARARQLGCSLDEIRQLAGAWDGGTCGPVQDQLRDLVVARVADTRQRITELTALADDLQRATVISQPTVRAGARPRRRAAAAARKVSDVRSSARAAEEQRR